MAKNYLLDPYKDHPFHKGLIDEETLTVVAKQDNNSKDENIKTIVESRHTQASLDDHLLEAFQKVITTIPLIDAIKHISSYAKFLKGICTPHQIHHR